MVPAILSHSPISLLDGVLQLCAHSVSSVNCGRAMIPNAAINQGFQRSNVVLRETESDHWLH